MKKIILLTVIFTIIAFLAGWYYHDILLTKDTPIPFTNKETVKEKPLEKYSFDNLSHTELKIGEFKIDQQISQEEKFTSYLFLYKFDSDLDGQLDKSTSGIINLPNQPGTYPTILMFRGYVDQKIYQSGVGTKNAAEYFANNNFITVAADFLGYADSDSETSNIFESRFQTYVTALSLLKYLQTSPSLKIENREWTIGNIGIWGHSNGGQIALTVLEATSDSIPTVLWAPVSKPFPYSILYYTDESEDRGKLIRSELSKFEADYDVDKYSLTNYLDKIKASIQLHQGTADDSVPLSWSQTLNENLDKLNVNLEFFTYPGADHNLRPSWNVVIFRSLRFYQDNLKN